MNPEQPADKAEATPSNGGRPLGLALTCLLGPSALFVIGLLAYVLGGVLSFPDLGFMILVLTGIISTTTWLPGIIIGIFLLISPRKKK